MGLARPKDERVFPTHYDQGREMTQLLKDNPWIEDVQCQARQEVLADLHKAWSACFNKENRQARKPHWKRKGDPMRIFAPAATVPYDLTGDRKTGKLTFGGPRYKPLGTLKIVLDRPTKGIVKGWSIKRDGQEWYAVAGCEIEIADPVPVNDKAVGIDRGIALFLADSDGRTVENIRAGGHLETRIARAQRQVDHKKRGSENQHKARAKVAKLLRLAARQREVLVHTASLYYAENYGTVVIEKLNLKNMTASAKGDEENPGSNVRQKAGLNRAMLDTAGGKFVEALKYKVDERGGRVPEVNPAGTSTTCSECGCDDPRNRPSQAVFHCISCGHEENADFNAAKNIKARGLTMAPPEPKKSKKRTFSRGRKPKVGETAVKPTAMQPAEATG
jgi:putative transposase